MKGVYMVDADRLFVQHFENLLFNNANEYKMLGHNFKANDFLNKLKERSDLLNKIDLLFVNPKLIDLNGLELIKKVQTFRKDINICVIINENMRTFYQNEISELGLEHIIIYPNSDEYYLNSVKSIFDKIEQGNKANAGGQNKDINNDVILNDEDLFAELNSVDFLKQFDFDELSDEFFKQSQEQKESLNVNEIEDMNDKENIHGKEDSTNVIQNENKLNTGSIEFNIKESITETEINNTLIDSEQTMVTPNFGVDTYQESTQHFITPNFSWDDNKEHQVHKQHTKSKLFGDVKYPSPSFTNTEPNNNDLNVNVMGNVNHNTYRDDTPSVNDIGYNVADKNNNTFGQSEYIEPQFNKPNVVDSVNSNQNYQDNSLKDAVVHSPYGNDFGLNNKSFVEQTENSFDFNKTTNHIENDAYNGLDYTGHDMPIKNDYFNINEADIPGNPLDLSLFGVTQDNNFTNRNNEVNNDMHNSQYADNSFTATENNIFENNDIYNNDDVEMPYQNNVNGHQKTNLQNINRPDVDDVFGYEKQGLNTSYMPYGHVDNNKQHNKSNGNNGVNNVNRHRGFSEFVDVNKTNNVATKDTKAKGHGNSREFNNPYDEYSFAMKNRDANKQSQGFGGQVSQDMNAQNGQTFGNVNKANRHFEGFDFSKPIHVEEKTPHDVNLKKTGFNDNFNRDNDLTGFGTQASNKAVIEDMYNKTGVDTLNYSPLSNIKDTSQPIKHEQSNNAIYNEVPDFAKQIVTFYSTKGGIGKTSLAVNATIQLAKYSKKRICLIDFDVTNANIHTHLGILDSTYDLSVISNFESEIDSFSLSRIITPYRVKDKDGETVEFDVVVGFKEMKMSERFNEKEVHKILSILEEMYDIVVVDTHPVYTDITISTILKKATKIIFVTEQEMTALNGAKDFILASRKYGIPAEKLFMVLNRYKPQTTIFTKNRIEKSLNKTILATIPADMDHLRDAVNTNNPISISSPDCELSRAYLDVAKIIDTNMVVPEETKGFFKRFKR